ncbi:MAG: serine/threonine-protein phosphatase [Frankia sp.]|nr:serine/threonine-protein phosphatase [Frankia sp.]
MERAAAESTRRENAQHDKARPDVTARAGSPGAGRVAAGTARTGQDAGTATGGGLRVRSAADAVVAAMLGEAVAEAVTDALATGLAEALQETLASAVTDTVAAAVARELPSALAAAMAAAPPGPGTAAAGVAALVEPADERAVELAAARASWESLAPRTLPALPGLDLAARRVPASDARRVGGDWYDVTALSADRVLLDAGDVGGHGPAAAALTAELCHAARAYALLGMDPSEIITRLTDVLVARGTAVPASAVAARLDIPTGRLTWSSAGHPPPVLVHDGEASFLGDVHGPLLGAAQDSEYPQSAVTVPLGATVLFYTAGLVDRPGMPLAYRLDLLATAAARTFGTVAADGTTPAPLAAACDELVAQLAPVGADRAGAASKAGAAAAAPADQELENDVCLLAARLC